MYNNLTSWTEQWRKMRMLLTFFWPDVTRGIQVRFLLCMVIAAVETSTSILVPAYNQKIGKCNRIYNSSKARWRRLSYISVDSLDKKEFCWDLIMIYVGLKFLSMGALWTLRTFMWLHVNDFIKRIVETKLFSHMHSLSLRWHSSNRSSEILAILTAVPNSICHIVSYCIFRFAPAILDVAISVVFLTATFNWYFGILVTITLALYLREWKV